MRRREFLAGVGAMTLTASQTSAKSNKQVAVRLETDVGPIIVNLAMDRAPITACNFMRYVTEKRYDATSFYRAYRQTKVPATGLIQGGILPDSVEVLSPIAHESTQQTGLSHQDGTISLARYAPGTATCHFFICIGDMSYLDAHPDKPGDNLGFAAFGQVAEGMDVVRKIHALPTSPTAGEGVMRGQLLEPPVSIIRARNNRGSSACSG